MLLRLEKGDFDGLQEILFLARRPREQEAVVALARPAVHGDQHPVLGFVDMATGNASEHTRTNQKEAMLQLIGDRVGLIFAQSA